MRSPSVCEAGGQGQKMVVEKSETQGRFVFRVILFGTLCECEIAKLRQPVQMM